MTVIKLLRPGFRGKQRIEPNVPTEFEDDAAAARMIALGLAVPATPEELSSPLPKAAAEEAPQVKA